MNKRGEEKLFAGVMILFVTLLIGLTFLPSIRNTAVKVTTPLAVINDSVTNVANTNGSGQINNNASLNTTHVQYSDWRSGTRDACPYTSVTLTNSSGTSYTLTTDYLFNTTYGNFTLKNTAKVNASIASDNLTYVSYTHCDTGYSTESSARAGMDLITLLLIIALIIAGANFAKENFE